MNIQELQTMVNYGCNVKTFILNNHILGNTKSWQRVNHRAEIACGPDGYKPPDFLKIADAYGIQAARIDAESEFLLPLVMAEKGPWIADVVHDDFCTYEPRISRWDIPIEDMYPHLPRDEFRANMYTEPWKGWEDIK